MIGAPSGAAVFLLARGCKRCSIGAKNTTLFEHFNISFASVQCMKKRGELPVSRKHDQPANNVGSTLRTMREERKMTREKLSERAERIFYPEAYSGDSDMELISRLSATCSPKQRKMIIAFIEMMLDHEEFE